LEKTINNAKNYYIEIVYSASILLLLYNFASIKLALRDCFIAVICDQTFLVI